jgi:DNA-directed RNA polymerase subunit RPC12/RpoP
VSRAKNWIQEERRKALGDWVAFCLRCGFTLRYFEESESELPSACPECESELRARCPRCGGRFSSAFDVRCDSCGAEVRPAEVFGVPIRKPAKRR